MAETHPHFCGLTGLYRTTFPRRIYESADLLITVDNGIASVEGVDAALGLHVWLGLPSGVVGVVAAVVLAEQHHQVVEQLVVVDRDVVGREQADGLAQVV